MRPDHHKRGGGRRGSFDPRAAAGSRPVRRRRNPRPEEVSVAQTEGRRVFVESRGVSRETLERLDRYVALLTEWQARTNLVAPATLGEVWQRHIADSYALIDHLPSFQRAVDLGSGGGLPGLVIAIERDGSGAVDLIESNAKKAAFLRTVQRELGLAGTTHAARIEDRGSIIGEADIVTARALAPLPELCALVAPHLAPASKCFFAKGISHEEEIAEASAHWRFTMIKHPLEGGSVVLEISGLAPR